MQRLPFLTQRESARAGGRCVKPTQSYYQYVLLSLIVIFSAFLHSSIHSERLRPHRLAFFSLSQSHYCPLLFALSPLPRSFTPSLALSPAPSSADRRATQSYPTVAHSPAVPHSRTRHRSNTMKVARPDRLHRRDPHALPISGHTNSTTLFVTLATLALPRSTILPPSVALSRPMHSPLHSRFPCVTPFLLPCLPRCLLVSRPPRRFSTSSPCESFAPPSDPSCYFPTSFSFLYSR